jgi:hypothetical protein
MLELVSVGPDEFTGWTKHGMYVVGQRQGAWVFAYGDRDTRHGTRLQVIGRFNTLRDAKIAAQAHADAARRRKR